MNALTLQAGDTLVELNRMIMQGEELTALQEQCLGSFEEGFGEPLLALDCGEDSVTQGNIDIRMNTVSLFNTTACRNSLLEFSTEDCVLQSMSAELGPVWEIPTTGGRPLLIFSGAEVDYAINGTALQIGNTQDALTGIFSCNIELTTLGASESASESSCESIVSTTVMQIEELQNP